jgi:predicted DNA-binding transcriptional regulator YafY
VNPTLARLRRILVMVPWLLDHPGVGVAEVAARFGVTPEEVLADLDVLGYCGLPGYGGGDLIEATVSGSGQVVVRMADFFARPLALSVREGLALLLAARSARASGVLGDDVTDGALASAIAKLEQHLGAQAEIPVAVDVEASGQDHLARLLPAVEGRRVVTLTYRSASKDETTVRDVEPWAVTASRGAWYLQGHCRLAGAPRAFHLDRILDLVVTDQPAPDPPRGAIPPPVYQPAPEDPLVVVDVAPGAAWLSDLVVLADRAPAADGWTRLTFQVAALDWAARLLVLLGAGARVVEPPALAARVRERATSALARYDHPD